MQKSSLLNWLVGEKSLWFHTKPMQQEKRSNIIVMHEDDQSYICRYSGIHETEKLLNQFMLDETLKAMEIVDLILFLAPVTDKVSYYRRFLVKIKRM